MRPPDEVLGEVLGPEVGQGLRDELHELPGVPLHLQQHGAQLRVKRVPGQRWKGVR